MTFAPPALKTKERSYVERERRVGRRPGGYTGEGIVRRGGEGFGGIEGGNNGKVSGMEALRRDLSCQGPIQSGELLPRTVDWGQRQGLSLSLCPQFLNVLTHNTADMLT